MQVFDGITNQTGGMNGGMLNTLIGKDQFARGINITCRNGEIATRPPFIEIVLASEDEGVADKIREGKFQGMYTYHHENNTYIAFAVSGSVYLIDPLSGTIVDATVVPGLFNEYVDRLHFCQVERFLVVQDGLNLPLIVEGLVSRKAVPGDDEVPIGTVMAYCHGRLFIKTEDRSFIAGDIFMPNAPTNVLIFTETQYLAGGGAFTTPTENGNIVAMTWAQAYGTATGQGPLIVMCERGMSSFAVFVPRLDWQDMPIHKIEPGNNGCSSEFGVVRMNEDLLFIGWHGLEDFSLLNAEAAQHHRMTNLNTEIKPFLDEETSWMLPYVHAARFDDRLLFTSIGQLCTAVDTGGSEVEDYRFTGFVSLDFAPVDGLSRMGQVTKPSYDGIWTGVHPMGIASGIFNFEERCFVFGKDDDGVNHLYELMKEQGHDGGGTPIECAYYTRSLPFVAYDKDNPRPVPHMQKKLLDGSIWISSFEDNLDVVLSVCPDMTVHFHELSTIHVDAPMAEITSPFLAGLPQSRPKQKWPAFSENSCEMVSGRLANTGFELQFRISWAGILKFHRFLIAAEAHNEKEVFECNQNTTVLTGTIPQDYNYDMES